MESPIEQTPTLSPLTPPAPPSTASSAPSRPLTPGDARRGAALFASVCAHCHNVEAGQPHKFGPTLDGVYGTRAGRIPGSRPSEAMKRTGEEGGRGVVWGTDTLVAYLADCRGYVPGSKKPFKGVESERDRVDIVAFLQEKASSAK